MDSLRAGVDVMAAPAPIQPPKSNQFVDIVPLACVRLYIKEYMAGAWLEIATKHPVLTSQQKPRQTPGHFGLYIANNIYYAHFSIPTHGPLPPLPYVYTQPLVNFIFKPFLF